MSKRSTWFCFYDDFFNHPKTKRLTAEQKIVVGVGWCFASRSPVRGVLLINEDLPASLEDIAKEADLPIEVVQQALGTLENPGPITRKGMYLAWREDGVLCSPNWRERQPVFADRTNAERQRKHREKLAKSNGSNGDSNALRNGESNGLERERELDFKPLVVVDDAPGKVDCLQLIDQRFPTWHHAKTDFTELLDHGQAMTWPVLQRAVETTLGAGKTSIRYCLGILEKWSEGKVRSLGDVEVYEKRVAVEMAARRRGPRGQGHSKQSNVLLQRNGPQKPDDYYDYIFQRFEGGASTGGGTSE